MALADPQVLPSDPEIVLDRISSVLGRFGSSDSTYELAVDHSRKGRARHVAKLTLRKIAADPLLPTQNREYTQSVHVVMDAPLQGFVASEQVALASLFVEFLATEGLLEDLIQGQA